MPFDVDELTRFPSLPGVYLMKDSAGTVLYIGKANNIRTRVKQYFIPGRDGREMVPFLVAQIERVDTLVVTTEKEALILENNLIKHHKPKYNVLLKDSKKFFSLSLNHKHPWPMLRIARFTGTPPKDHRYFGPYTNSMAARETLEFLRELFPLRQCSDRELLHRTRPCILYELKRCIAPCVQKCTAEEYQELVTQATQFLEGNAHSVLQDLRESMEEAASQLAYEKAAHYYRMIQNIETTLEKQKVEQVGLEATDVLGLYREGSQLAISLLSFREGKLLHSQDYFFPCTAQTDAEIFSSFLLQTYSEQTSLPVDIILPLRLPNAVEISTILSADQPRRLHLLTGSRGKKRDLVKMAEANAHSHFTRETHEEMRQEQVLISMEETLHLTNYPDTIECFDQSHLAGADPVSAMVVFIKGKKAPKHYRKYTIRSASGGDDYAMLREALERRYTQAKEKGLLPDLLLIDGGKGHLELARSVLSTLDISTVDIISMAKQESKHTKGLTAEQLFLAGQDEPLLLDAHSPLLFFLQNIRDEAHRFVLAFQRNKRSKSSLHSVLDTLPGIGAVKKKRLLSHFGSVKRILQATPPEWLAVPGITQKDVERLQELKRSTP